MDYSEKYKTAQWQQKKCEILVRDNFTCQVCGFSSNDDANSSKLLHVHHRYYIKGKDEVWDYPNEALITLCEDCHAKEHSFDGSLIQNAIQNALNSGVLGIEIVEVLNNMANKMKCHMPKNQSFLIPKKTAISRVFTKPDILLKQTRTLKRYKTKQELLDELAIYANQYEAGYLQEFKDYWFEDEDQMGNLRCYSESSFIVSDYLENWKNIRENIIRRKAELFAIGEYALYDKWFNDIVENEKKENAGIIEKSRKELQNLINDNIDILKNTLMINVMPDYNNRGTTVYNYLIRHNIPAIYAEMYRYDGWEDYEDKYENKKNDRTCKNSKRFFFDAYDSSQRNSYYPQQIKIDLIESFFNLRILYEIKEFKRLIHYKINHFVYEERQKMRFLTGRAIDVKKGCDSRIWNTAKISLTEFELLYLTNQLLRENTKKIISSIESLDDSILLSDFCKLAEMSFFEEDENLTLKKYLYNKIDSFEPERTFNPVLICIESGTYIRIVNNNKMQIPIKLRECLNVWYDMNFILYELKFDNVESSTIPLSYYWGNIKETDFIPPLEILTNVDGVEFDFCAERFYKGTMKSVTIPDNASEKNLMHYLEKVQELVTKYEKALIERKLKS